MATQTNGSGTRSGISRRGPAPSTGATRTPAAQPDVLVDAPGLKLDELELQIDDVRVKSQDTEVHLGKLHLNAKNLDAQALVELRLDPIAGIVDRIAAALEERGRMGRGSVIDVPGSPSAGRLARLAAGAVAREAASAAADGVKDVGLTMAEKAKELGERRRERRAERLDATPAALEAADELGVDLDDLNGSGLHGRITVRDVREAASPE